MSTTMTITSVIEHWLAEEKIRPIDYQLAKQVGEWERQAGTTNDELITALMLTACAASYALGRGQVCLDLSHWPAALTVGSTPDISVLAECRTVCTPDTIDASALLVLQGQRVYLNRYFQYEQSVLEQIRKRLTPLGVDASPQLAETLSTLFPQNGETDWQAVAAATACLQPLCVITGGPGTGKTTTVTKLLSALLSENEHLRIALAAPTGKAAARMTESIRQAREKGGLPHADGIPSTSFTLHRLLGWSSRGFRYHSERWLPYDCVVVDEASMIDLPMMAHLLSALAPTARLVLLGDRDQLASVEAGSVLADLCDAGVEHGVTAPFAERLQQLTGCDLSGHVEAEVSLMQNAMMQLRKSHRFDEHSGIGALARAVNQGDQNSAERVFGDVGFRDVLRLPQDSEEWQRYVVEGYRQYCELIANKASPEWILDAFDQFQVLVALRNGPFGVEETNRRIERLLNRAGLLSDTGQNWYSGRAIMITRNDYDIGLYNGDIGIMIRHEDQDRVVFRDTDGGLRFLSPGRLPSHETAFAMTVHKSQGSEFAEVLLMLPARWQQVITRELVYTALTRAKKKFICQAGDACWNTALNTRTERASGLRDQLWVEQNS
ncbi:MAG: exodeoxyribonuclease V subunit alpha [Thalassolituus sp.]